MSDSSAQRKLRDAVDEFVREEWGEHPGMMMADWALLTYHRGWDEEDHAISSYGTAYMNGDMADHQAIGLFRLIADRLQHRYNTTTLDPRDQGNGSDDGEMP